jgi:hypothetical protein
MVAAIALFGIAWMTGTNLVLAVTVVAVGAAIGAIFF